MPMIEGFDSWEDYFDELDGRLYSAKYDLKISERDGLPQLETFPKEDNMPDLEIVTHNENGVIYFTTILTFPVLDSNELNYYDSTHYYIEKWENVGSVVSYINQLEVELD